MRTAFVIDFLLERTPEVFLLELLLASNEEAEIYCLAHAPGKILGRVEYHRIHASPLSRFVKSASDLKRFAWMIPSAARQLSVPVEVEKVVIISSGWAHLIQTAPTTKRFTWMYQLNSESSKLQGWQRIFSIHHQEVKKKKLGLERHLAFSSENLADLVGKKTSKVIRPAFKTEDFPFASDFEGPFWYHLINLNGADPRHVRKIMELSKETQTPLRFVGKDDAYAAEKSEQNKLWEFIGDHCDATLAAVTHEARAVWCLGMGEFPREALGTLACGRPVVVWDQAQYHEVIPSDAAWFIGGTDDFRKTFQAVNESYLTPERKVLRRAGLKYNERLFKAQMKTWTGELRVSEITN